jgi:hypothetical protein
MMTYAANDIGNQFRSESFVWTAKCANINHTRIGILFCLEYRKRSRLQSCPRKPAEIKLNEIKIDVPFLRETTCKLHHERSLFAFWCMPVIIIVLNQNTLTTKQ